VVAGLLLLLQAGGWSAAPAGATVGDTVWVERIVSAPAGWRVRAGKLEATEQVEPLGEPVVLRAASGWLVRYPVVGWAPGRHALTLPPVWRLGPDGSADSVPGGSATFELRSVIPDTLLQPAPQPAITPLRPDRRSPLPPLAAGVVAAGLLVAGVRWRRRAPRALSAPPQVPLEPEVPDGRWLAAGEPKAVAARARQRLRAAVAGAVPQAHEALSTAECLAAVERLRPDAPLRELRDVLGALDHVAFASAHGADLATLAERARALAGEFTW